MRTSSITLSIRNHCVLLCRLHWLICWLIGALNMRQLLGTPQVSDNPFSVSRYLLIDC